MVTPIFMSIGGDGKKGSHCIDFLFKLASASHAYLFIVGREIFNKLTEELANFLILIKEPSISLIGR